MIINREFSQGLEKAEAQANAAFVETRRRLECDSTATWVEIGGAYALFDSVGSPCTQTFGLGLFEEPSDSQLVSLEKFFRERGAEVFHEVSPLADPSILSLLSSRNYVPIELTSVMYLDLDKDREEAATTNILTRVIESDEIDLWASTSAAGWSADHTELAEFLEGYSRVGASCPGSFPFIGEIDGRPIATGALHVFGDVAMLAGASTIPEGRRRGAQNALLAARLAKAKELGCRLAVMAALPGSQSQCNAQRNGFQIAYTRIKWSLQHR